MTAQKTQNIITANIAGLQEDVLARLPKLETIQRDVRRNRPNNHQAVPDIYNTQFALPHNSNVDVLGRFLPNKRRAAYVEMLTKYNG